jgi:hypothetical protein
MAADRGMLEFWDYGDGPDLVFQRQRTYRYARNEEMSDEYLRYVHDLAPEVFAPAHPRIVAGAPFQAAAFRAADGAPALEVYAALPGGALRAATDAPETQTGVFVVTGDLWEHRASLLGTRATAARDTLLDAAFPLPPGRYVVSVEATAGDIAAQSRERAEVPSFAASPALSDALLVDRFEAEPLQAAYRAELRPVVSRTRVFARGAPVGIVWEIYGLATDSSGTARYGVTAEVADSSHGGAALAARGGALGAVAGTRLSWEASRIPRADGTVVEHVTLDLPDARPGSYHLFITVTDRLTGRAATVVRGLAIAP